MGRSDISSFMMGKRGFQALYNFSNHHTLYGNIYSIHLYLLAVHQDLTFTTTSAIECCSGCRCLGMNDDCVIVEKESPRCGFDIQRVPTEN